MNIRWVSLEKSQTEMMVGMLFSHLFVSDSLQPHGLQHTRLLCLSLSPRSCSNSCPLSRWCHPTSSSSVVPFSSCLQFFPASGSFLVSWLFTLDGQSIGVSASASVLPMNIQCWFWKGCCWEPFVMPGFVTSRGQDFNPGSEMRLDSLELFV